MKESLKLNLFERKHLVAFFAILLSFLGLGHLLNPYLLHVYIYILLYAYLGISWNILGGYTGQLSLGHSIFFGIGAYTSTLLSIQGVSPWLGMMLGGIISALVGTFLGFLCFRYGLKGPYFALATLAFGEVIRIGVDNFDAIGGAQGLLVPLGNSSLMNFQFFEKIGYFHVIFFLTVGALVVSFFIEKCRMGAYFSAIREDEVAAQSLGINTTKYKILATAISSFLTSFGGTFYAQYVMFINADSVFNIGTSIEIILRPIVGGMGSFVGAVIGAFLLGPLSELTRVLLGEYSGVHLITYGILLMVIILFMPEGLLNYFKGLLGRPLNPLHRPSSSLKQG